VDPHIRKIWDKVEENATTKTMAIPTPVDISLGEEAAESIIVSSLPKVEENATTKMMAIPTPVDISLGEEAAELTIVSSLPNNDATNDNPETLPIDVPVTGEDAQDVLHPTESTPPLASVPLHFTSTQGEAQSAPSTGGVIGAGASSSPSDSPSAGEDDLDNFLCAT
jgi:hypothetical protein